MNFTLSLSFSGTEPLHVKELVTVVRRVFFTIKPEWRPVILSPILVEVNSYLIFQGSMTACDMFLVSRE